MGQLAYCYCLAQATEPDDPAEIEERLAIREFDGSPVSLHAPPLPTLNELLAASRKSPYSANALKQRAQYGIIMSM